MAMVKEIQVCGGHLFQSLGDACVDYLQCVASGVDRQKLNFSVLLDNGKTKHITFRQEDDGIHVYGDFASMPDAYQWAKRVLGR